MIWTILGVLFVLTLFFVLALCRIAAQVSRWEEEQDWGDDDE